MLQSYNRILVFGAGAVGGYFGSQLAIAGCDVDFVARGARLAAYQKNGLTLSNEAGELHNIKIKATAVPDGMYDLIIISVKAKDTKDAVKACRKHLSSHGAVLPLQNGVDNTQLLEATFDASRVVGAVVRSGISVPEPGVIHYKPNPRITLGGVSEKSKRHESPLRALFMSAGVICTISDDIRQTAWMKLMWNAAFNPLSAITRSTCGELADSKHSTTLMYSIAAEVVAVAMANGVNMPYNAIEKTLTVEDEYRNYKTSSLQDVESNRVPETAELLEPILKWADQSDISTPVTRAIADLSAFMFKRWFHSFPRLAADVIVVAKPANSNNDKSVLLIERKFPPYGWAIPGGMAELGETIERTAVRELQEETSIDVTEEQLTLLGIYSDPTRDFRGHTVSAVYYTFTDQTPVAADDAKNARYFPLDELPELAFDHAKVLEDLKKRL